MVSEDKDLAVLGSCAIAVKKPMLCNNCKQGDGYLGSQEPSLRLVDAIVVRKPVLCKELQAR